MIDKEKLERMDIVTRKKYPLSSLIRLSLKDGVISFRKEGKGIYILKDKDTISTCLKRKTLSRFGKVDEEVLRELENYVR